MFLGFGTVVNFGLVLLGSSFGLWARRGIPERLRVGVMHAIGIFTLLLGVKLLVENKPETIKVFFLLVLGAGLATGFRWRRGWRDYLRALEVLVF
jgi:Uncharacterized membrane protein, possible Na+ channel or pump